MTGKPGLQRRSGNIKAGLLLAVKDPADLRKGHYARNRSDFSFVERSQETIRAPDIVLGRLGCLGEHYGNEDVAVQTELWPSRGGHLRLPARTPGAAW